MGGRNGSSEYIPAVSKPTLPTEICVNADDASKATVPSVAVVIPCWNAERWIARAIQSVLDQNYPNLEIIVIDDGSTDGSLEIVKSFGGKIRWETGPNRGACAARNIGLSMASSKYAIFLDADDYLDKDYLANLSAILQSGNHDLVFASYALENDRGRQLELHYPLPDVSSGAIMSSWLDDSCNPFTAAMIFSVEFLRRVGGWNTSVKVLQDFEVGLRALLAKPLIGISPASIAIYVQNKSPARISRTRNGEAWQTVLSFLERYVDRIENCYDAGTLVQYGVLYYRTARMLYQARSFKAGDRALRRSREVGFCKHVASGRDLVFIKCFGLKNREKLGLIKRYLARRFAL
jgi:glycosyltransferase involved in cell wall biosynthesis